MVDYVKNFPLGFLLKETGCASYVACDVGRLFFFPFCNFLQNLCLENIQSDFSGTRKVENIRRLLTLLQHLSSTTDSSFSFLLSCVNYANEHSQGAKPRHCKVKFYISEVFIRWLGFVWSAPAIRAWSEVGLTYRQALTTSHNTECWSTLSNSLNTSNVNSVFLVCFLCLYMFTFVLGVPSKVLRRQVLKNASAKPRINCITTDDVVGGDFFLLDESISSLAPVRGLGKAQRFMLSARQTHNYSLMITFAELCISQRKL